MLPEDDAYKDLERIDPHDPAMVAYWAARWGVTPNDILAAISRVGSLLRDVAPEIWKHA